MKTKRFKQTEMEKIPEDWEECKRQGSCFKFKFKDKSQKIRFIEFPKEPFISNGGPKRIKVGKLFFEEFNKKEKIAILWHEFYHCRWTYLFKIGELEIKYSLLDNKKSIWEEEYNADKFSARNNSIDNCLSYLNVCKILYDHKVIKRNKKLHPPIEERIKRIKQLR